MLFAGVDQKLAVEEDFRKPLAVDQSIYRCNVFFSDLLRLGKIRLFI